MKQLFLFSLLLISVSCFAQTNADKAKAAYFKADENFQAANFQGCIDKLNEAIQLLGSSNARIQYLMSKSYKELGNYKQVKIELGKYFGYKPNEDEWYKEMLLLSDEIDGLIKQKDDAEALKKKQMEEAEALKKKQKEEADLLLKTQKEAADALAKKKQEAADLLSKQDEEAWAVANSLNTELSFQNYINKFPAGKHAQDAQRLMYERIIANKVKDVDGNVYNLVMIGNQIWMAENLKTTKYNDGSEIPLVTKQKEWSKMKTPAYCWYDNDSSKYKNTYGALYNWYTVNTAKLCPTGYHVPSDAEWTVLTDFLGGESVAGGKMKAPTIWRNPNVEATNSSGFACLLGGYRDEDLSFTDLGESAVLVSSTHHDTHEYVWLRALILNDGKVVRGFLGEKDGVSVRCSRDK